MSSSCNDHRHTSKEIIDLSLSSDEEGESSKATANSGPLSLENKDNNGNTRKRKSPSNNSDNEAGKGESKRASRAGSNPSGPLGQFLDEKKSPELVVINDDNDNDSKETAAAISATKPESQLLHPIALVFLECIPGEEDNAVVTNEMAQALHTYSNTNKKRFESQQTSSRLYTCCDQTGSALSALCHLQQKDKWSCGYRNTQMILSALAPWIPHDHAYFRKRGIPTTTGTGILEIPHLRQLQRTLEAAWASGLDPDGAQHYSYKIVNKAKWIGAVEVWSMLAYWNFDACVVQFIKCRESRRLLEPFCYEYFASPNTESLACLLCSPLNSTTTTASMVKKLLQHAEKRPKSDAKQAAKAMANPPSSSPESTCSCSRLPLYLQWAGHSVTVVGVECDAARVTNLIVLDPLKNASPLKKYWSQQTLVGATKNAGQALGRLPISTLLNRDCQLVVASPRVAYQSQVNGVTAAALAVQQTLGRAGH